MKAPIYGKDKILMFRRLKDAASGAGARLALQIEHTWNYERSTDSKQTKDGNLAVAGGLEVTLDFTAVSTKDAVNKMLLDSVIKGDKLEVWEVDLSAPELGGKYPALYAQGSLESWEVPDNVEDTEDISSTMKIDGVPVEGQATLTPEDLNEIKAAYAFKDTVIGTV